MKKIVFFFIFSLIGLSIDAQSVLSNGSLYKIKIDERGIYKLSYQFLSDNGIPVNNIDPTTFKIYGQKGGMLPQRNDTEWPNDPVEIAIKVVGESDNNFGSNDYILFYAESGDSFEYIGDELTYSHNLYSDENYYFLTFSGNKGLRIENAEPINEVGNDIETFNDFKYYKEENNNLLTSGRSWYSFRFNNVTSQEYAFQFPSLVSGSSISVTSRVMAQAFENSSFNIYSNNNLLGNIEVPSIPDYNQRVFRYAIKGQESQSSFNFANSNNNITIKVEYNKNTSHSIGFLDFLQVEALSKLELVNGEVQFRSLESLSNSTSTYKINKADENTIVWEVSDHYFPKNQISTLSNGQLKFTDNSDNLKEYIAFDPPQVSTPSSLVALENQNIKSYTNAEFIIISHPNFLFEAERLAAFRQSNDGLESKVVDINQVYNEFSSGRQDISAIRNYAKYLYDNGSLKYLLLFGRGSYDYKGRLNNNTNYIPIYESRNSLDPLDTYASDDYFGFLEENEGDWIELAGGNHTIDIGLGRFPVKSISEATAVVDKLIHYSTSTSTLGEWRNSVVFVADDGDFNLHQRQADELTQFVDTTYTAFLSNKFFLDNFKQISRPSGETSPSASESLTESVEKGALIVNFTGHGGENGWMQEQVLNNVQIQNWDNYDKLPLFVTATCEFGRHDDPQRISGGELLVISNKGGGIAVVSTCRPVSSSSNFALNKAFYQQVFDTENNEYLRLGDIFRLTKNESINLATDLKKVGNRNFSLLGDPTLRLNYPKKKITISGINSPNIKSDTLKALSKITLNGQINNFDDIIDTDFDGHVDFILFDKPVTKTTLGNENSPYTYKDKENIIFRGSSTIQNGVFNIEFIVPKNISYQVGNGFLNMYAISSNNIDANGSEISLKVGGSNPNPETDNQGPGIKLFIGDTLNNSLSQVSHNTSLVAILNDENGINLSSYGIGNNITAILDNEIEFNLNNYYKSFPDNYKRGYLSFPLNDLEKGEHSITLKAWDTFNNSSESTINFNVADPNSVVIYDLYNYPNPFSHYTTFGFSHNKSGENLEVEFEIYSPISGLIIKRAFNIENASSKVNLFEWDGTNSFGENLKGGIYIYRLNIRSKRDGAKNSAHKKLILIN